MTERAAAEDEEAIRKAMAAYGVRIRAVEVLPGPTVTAWAPVCGRMRVRAGFLTAAGWRRAAILAHEAGHVRQRHWGKVFVLFVALEAGLLVLYEAARPWMFSGPGQMVVGLLGMLAAQVGVWVGALAVGRRQEYAADRWAVERGGITGGEYRAFLEQVHRPTAATVWNRLLATHPTPEQRMARVARWLDGRPQASS